MSQDLKVRDMVFISLAYDMDTRAQTKREDRKSVV